MCRSARGRSRHSSDPGGLFQLTPVTPWCPLACYALMFLVVGLIANALNLLGVSAVCRPDRSWILFLIGVVLLVVRLVSGRTPRTT